jgi:transposase-like protein
MAMKDYSEEFKADAVALYDSTPGATYKGIAADLGVARGTLRAWVLAEHERRGVDPGLGPEVLRPTPARVPRGALTPEAARIRELEARVRALEASERKLATERDILRKAAKYFAGETNW